MEEIPSYLTQTLTHLLKTWCKGSSEHFHPRVSHHLESLRFKILTSTFQHQSESLCFHHQELHFSTSQKKNFKSHLSYPRVSPLNNPPVVVCLKFIDTQKLMLSNLIDNTTVRVTSWLRVVSKRKLHVTFNMVCFFDGRHEFPNIPFYVIY